MKLLSLTTLRENSDDGHTTARPSLTSWPWTAYCHQQPKTLSFRANDDIFRTINSVFQLDSPEPRRGRITECLESSIFKSMEEEEEEDEEASVIETAVSAARSERRLTFEPEETSSIVEQAEASGRHAPFIKESVSLSMDSRDPYVDFRQSMAEMVEVHALKDKWDRLEELLSWYLDANDKANHGYIFAAFVDLVTAVRGGVCAAESLQCNLSQSPSSPLLSYTSTSNSCCSSSTLSTPCGVSVMEAEESGGSGRESAAAGGLRLPSSVADPTGE